MKIRHLLLAGVAIVAVGSANAATNVALGKATSSSSIYDDRFVSGNVVDGNIIDSDSPFGYWLSGEGGVAGEWVQVDLGGQFSIDSFSLFNTHNRDWQDRGIQGFTLSVSADGTAFTDVASTSFTNAQWLDQTALSIDPASTVLGRYVRVTANSCFGCSGVGLAELQVYGVSAVPEPGTYALMALGLAALGMVARRRQA
ncbi:discoidin domain-containing protein [Aquincola sp. MAHUQ-54]|uniref:Discoidin domain-containing protein n=1 Tax=Aquincola agrisoli TaxID=3119538 RepID=A0AAW9QDI9_9BURK